MHIDDRRIIAILPTVECRRATLGPCRCNSLPYSSNIRRLIGDAHAMASGNAAGEVKPDDGDVKSAKLEDLANS
jgi:hypothetical protein